MTGIQRLTDPHADARRNSFGRLLTEWRNRRGYLQLDLALAARTTQLSFIESGRATPSRDMILRISRTMDIPLRHQNAMLLAAGYAPVWNARDPSAPDMVMVDRALDYMLGNTSPILPSWSTGAGTYSVPIWGR